mgnify:CR=1 FL=1
MKLFDFFRFRRKKNAETKPLQPSEDAAVTPIEFDPAEIEIPDSRFTEEYQAFLEAQETTTLPEIDEAVSQSGSEEE